MRAYENDTRINIPRWYRYIPNTFVNVVVKIFDFLNNIKRKKRRNINLENKQNIRFYL